MSEERMPGKIYLIECLGKDTNYRYYAEHGEMGGVPDAIGYDIAVHARKFRTEAEAQDFIRTELPEWGRELHRPVIYHAAGYSWEGAGLAAMLQCGVEIPAEILEPTAGRLRIWRC